MTKALDLTGKTFGKYTVIGKSEKKKYGKSYWVVQCSCGHVCENAASCLVHGKATQCHACKKTTHGYTGTRLHRIWKGMKSRCYYVKHGEYANYGGRGITVCPEWKNSFEVFKAWADSNGYQENLSIERNDVNGSYEPSNCEWKTNQEQQRNRRDNVLSEDVVSYIRSLGVVKNIAALARELNLSYTTVYYACKGVTWKGV